MFDTNHFLRLPTRNAVTFPLRSLFQNITGNQFSLDSGQKRDAPNVLNFNFPDLEGFFTWTHLWQNTKMENRVFGYRFVCHNMPIGYELIIR